MCLTVGVIGAGIIAAEHLKALKVIKGMKAIAVVDIDVHKVKRLSSEFNIASYTDYRNMILKETPDVVVITLPHYLHKDAAIYSADQGCHILLEKPMALNTNECEEIIQAANRNNVQLMVGHIQHYFQENIIAKQIIEEQRLGKLAMVNDIRYMNYFTPDRPKWFLERAKAGGGIVMNLGAHSIDKTQWMLGTHFSKVLAKLTYFSEDVHSFSDIEGSGLLYLESENGIPVSITLSGYEVVPKHVTELIFTNGMMKVESGKGVWVSNNNIYEKIDFKRATSPFERQFIDLRNAITENKRIESAQYAQSIIQVIEAIYKSHGEGKIIEFLQKHGD